MEKPVSPNTPQRASPRADLLEAGELNGLNKWANEQIGRAAEQEHRQSQKAKNALAQNRRGWVRGVSWRFGHINLLENLKVVIEGNGAHGERQDNQPEQAEVLRPTAEHRGEDVELAEKTCQRRYSGEGEHEDHHAKREIGRASCR